MRPLYRGLFILASAATLLAKTSFTAGTLLQAHGPVVLAGGVWQANYIGEEEPSFAFRLRLPLLFHENGQFVYPTIKNPPGPAFFSKNSSYALFLQELSLRKNTLFAGIGQAQIKNSYGNLLWGNPLYDPLAPYLGNQLILRLDDLEIYSSPLTHFELGFLRYSWHPMAHSEKNFWKSLLLRFQLFYEHQRSHGTGFEMENYLWQWEALFLGQRQSLAYILRARERLYQYSGGFFISYRLTLIDLGLLYQSAKHPYGPYLSSLTPGRENLPHLRGSSLAGSYLGLRLANKMSVLALRGEYYRPNIFSFRGNLEFKKNDFALTAGAITEGIGQGPPKKDQVFYSVNLLYFAVGDFLVWRSENYFNFYRELLFRGEMSLTWTF
ncbi:MAG: hypothetical protein NZM25_02075 [Leptospiraceae bacterium]|nr:hypothetical protein [Leptospiraceae bacterium]MDW8306964.1 hypothetical protein [Leptospiraceae bacterium]